MIDLFNIARGQVSVVNTPVLVNVKRSLGYTTASDGTRTPIYNIVVGVKADVQPLTNQDLNQIDGLNMGGEKTAMYLSGKLLGVLRAGQNGGDVIEFQDGKKYLVVLVLEQWANWVKVAAVRQV